MEDYISKPFDLLETIPFMLSPISDCGFCERPTALSWEEFHHGLYVGKGHCDSCGHYVLSVTGEPDLVDAFLDVFEDASDTIMTMHNWSPFDSTQGETEARQGGHSKEKDGSAGAGGRPVALIGL